MIEITVPIHPFCNCSLPHLAAYPISSSSEDVRGLCVLPVPVSADVLPVVLPGVLVLDGQEPSGAPPILLLLALVRLPVRVAILGRVLSIDMYYRLVLQVVN